MTIQVRRANTADVDWILKELRKFSAFYGTKLSLFGEEPYARGFITTLVSQHLVLVAIPESQTDPIGFISGTVTPHAYNPEIRVLTETFWWVQEEHRGSRAGLLLLNEFTEWGKQNVDWITFSLEHHSPVKDTCLTKRGFKLQERAFLMEVER